MALEQNKTITILVADELELVATGLNEMLRETEFKVIAYAQTGIEVLEWLGQNTVDLLLLDVSLAQMDGIDTTREVHRLYPSQTIMAHSRLHEIEYINSMLIEGASGYILKDANLREFEYALRTVSGGGKYLSPAAQEAVDKGYRYTEKSMDGEYMGLSQREREIIKLIALEKTNKEIADQMFLSIETIRTYRKSLMTKLNVKTGAGLVKYAVDRRWV